MRRILILWHEFRYGYYRQLLKDCLEPSLKRKLIKKAAHHNQKLKFVANE